MRRPDWDLHVPVVQWAYNTMCKTLIAETIPKVQNRAGTIISKENAKRNRHVRAPTYVIVREAQDEEITQLCEVKHIML